MKPLTEQQIIRLAKEFFQCEEGPEIGDVVVTDDLIKDFASELLALQGEPTKELCPICGRELTRTCFYCTKELCSPFNLQEKGKPTKDIPDENTKPKYHKCSKCNKEDITVIPDMFDGMCADCTQKVIEEF